MKERIQYIDAIKAFLIYVVIWGHLIPFFIENQWENMTSKWIFSFHMPLFMMLSGFWFGSVLRKDFKEIVKFKFKQLIVPSLTMIAFVFSLIYAAKPKTLQESIIWIWNTRPWFLITLFFCIMVSKCGYILFQRVSLGFTFSFLVFLFIPFLTEREIFMLPFFALGYYFYTYYQVINKYQSKLLLIFGGGYLSMLILCSNFDVYNHPFSLIHIMEEGVQWFTTDELYTAIVRYAIGASGCIVIFSLLKMFFQGKGLRLAQNKLIQFIGQNTLGLYIIQSVFFAIMVGLRKRIEFTATLQGNEMLPPILGVFVLLMLTCVVYLLRKNKTTRRIVLGVVE